MKSGSPWQNCFVERLIGSIRRECVDHLVVFGEQHLRRVLRSYALYYNEARTHRSLDKDPPLASYSADRADCAASASRHHQYVRI
jgi:transposase InsO family protein